MTLPVTFASLTGPELVFLDQNFAALGALTPIPCSVTGTDNLVLTPAADTPTISAYANYQPFTCVVANTNTTTMTARVGALAVLNVYKDTSSGPAAVASGNVVVANLLTLTYDSALNSGSGGFHAAVSEVVAGSYLPLSGGTLTGALVGTTASFSALNLGGSSTALTGMLSTTSSIVLPSMPPQTSGLSSVVLTGASIGDVALVGVPAVAASISGLSFNAYVADTGVVAVKATNATGSTVAPGGGVFTIMAMRVG